MQPCFFGTLLPKFSISRRKQIRVRHNAERSFVRTVVVELDYPATALLQAQNRPAYHSADPGGTLSDDNAPAPGLLHPGSRVPRRGGRPPPPPVTTAAPGPRPGSPESGLCGGLLILGLAAAAEAVGLGGGLRGGAEAGAVDPAPRPAAAAPGSRPGAITALAFITALQQGPN